MPAADGSRGFTEVLRAVVDLPEVVESTWYRTPALKVRNKGFCRLWSQREHDRDDVHDTEVLVVLCDIEEKQMLIETSNGTLFDTPHYRGHGAVLIRLADIEFEDLIDHLETSYRLKAPKTLIRILDQAAKDG